MAPFGQFLVEHHEAILQRWYDRWRTEGRPHEDLSEAALRNALPRQLEFIAARLASGSFRSEPARDLWHDAARLDPELRVAQGMAIEEIVFEYWLLVSTVRDLVEAEQQQVSFAEFTYFYEAVFELVAESVRRFASRQAEQVRRARSEYVAQLSHQMRGPLSVITLAAAKLRPASMSQDPDLAPLVEALDRNARRLQRQVENLMRLERYTAEEIPVRPQRIFPARVLDRVIEESQDEASRKGLRLEVRGNRTAEIEADPELLLDALGNLVENAVKYTERGAVTVSMDEVDDRVEFRVADTGPGIDERRRAELFQPTVPGKPGGVGLGLAVARRAAAAQQGEIGVRTEVGRGSEFWFTLPRRVAARTS